MQHWATDWNSLLREGTRKTQTGRVVESEDSVSNRNLLFNLRGTVHKVMAPELEGRILYQLNEGDEETPGMRPVNNQPLQQDPERRGQNSM